MDKEYYKRQYQLACEEIARLSAVLYSLREDIRTILGKKKQNGKQN